MRASSTGRNGGKKTTSATTLQLDGEAGRSRRGDAYDRLVSAIIFSDVEPGSVVDEKTLARELGLGLGPVRDALQRLSLEGMVERHPRIGTRIPDLTVRDLQDVFEARVMVEGQSAAIAAQRASASDIAEMRGALANVFEVVAQRDYRSLLRQDRRFHGALAAATGNRMLERLSRQLLNISSRFWFSGLPRMELDALQADMKAHLAVIDAVERRDVVGAENAMRKVLGRFPGAMSLFFTRMPA
jgi:GntR family transcriptional regulator, rspAB operon transcriptional repressor